MYQMDDKSIDNLIRSYARIWQGRFLYRWNFTCDYSDLMSEVNFAVGKSFYYYDPSKNVKFTSYAVKAITNQMITLLRRLIKQQKHFISLEELLEYNPDLKVAGLL